MEIKKIVNLFVDSFILLIKNPIIALPSVFMLLVQILFFPLFFKLNSSIIEQSVLIHWLYLTPQIIISLLVISFFTSLMIFLSKEVIKSKKSYSLKGYKFTFKTFSILIVYIILYLVLILLFYVISKIGNYFQIQLEVFSIVLFLVYMVALLGVFIFISFPVFISIVENFNVSKSIKSSILFVKNNYLSTLVLFIIFFILGELVKTLSSVNINSLISLSEIINFLIIYPLISLVFIKFYLANK